MSKNDIKKLIFGSVRLNERNPRKITPEAFRHLTRSILELPKMLELRPIVIDKDTRVILGGNMRYRALMEIAKLDGKQLYDEIMSIESVKRKTEEERQVLWHFWEKWRENPFIYVKETGLSEGEKTEFLVKDNTYFGKWDYDTLKDFSPEDLAECCIAPWEAFSMGMEEEHTETATGEDELKRIIIAFPRGRREELEQMLGIDKPGRTTYNINELIKESHENSI